MSVTADRGIVAKLAALTALGAGAAALALWYIRPITPWCDPEEDEPAYPRNLLRTYLPDAEFSGEVSVAVHASPEAIWDAMQRVTVEDMPIANWLGNVRYLPAHLSGRGSSSPAPKASMPFLQQVQTEGGNIVLGERPGAEYVLGAIGKFHDLRNQQFLPLRAPHEFVAFDHPDYQKLAMSFTITPLPDGTGQCLRLVHGTHALSPASRWRFALYWLAIKPGGNFVSWLMLRAIKSIAETSSVTQSNVRT